jgi:hypothetical protein
MRVLATLRSMFSTPPRRVAPLEKYVREEYQILISPEKTTRLQSKAFARKISANLWQISNLQEV